MPANKRTVSVRHARVEDVEQISALAVRAFRHSYEAFNTAADMDEHLRTVLSVANTRLELGDQQNVFLVAHFDDEELPVGYAKLSPDTLDASISIGKAAEINRFYAEPAAIGCGVGAALMRACIEEAGQRGQQALWLSVWKQNDLAIRFYERWEFVKAGERIFTLGTDPQVDWLMVRSIAHERK